MSRPLRHEPVRLAEQFWPAMDAALTRLVERAGQRSIRHLFDVAGLDGSNSVRTRQGGIPNALTIAALCRISRVTNEEFGRWLDEGLPEDWLGWADSENDAQACCSHVAQKEGKELCS